MVQRTTRLEELPEINAVEISAREPHGFMNGDLEEGNNEDGRQTDFCSDRTVSKLPPRTAPSWFSASSPPVVVIADHYSMLISSVYK